LLDVKLDIGVGHHARARGGPEVPDAGQLVAQPGAIGADDVVGDLGREPAGVDQAAHHVRREPDALLVGEEGDGEGAGRRHARVDQRLDHLETSQDAVVPVVDAAGGHRVDVRPAEHGSATAIDWSGGHHVADGGDGDVESEFAHPQQHQVATGPVGGGEGDPRAPTVVDGAD